MVVYVKKASVQGREPRQATFLQDVLHFNDGLFRGPEYSSIGELTTLVTEDVAELLTRLVRQGIDTHSGFSVPPDDPGFVNRDWELTEMTTYLKRATVPQPLAIYGMGGLGKTTLAIHFAHRYRGDFPSAVCLDLSRAARETVLLELAALYGQQSRLEALQREERQTTFIRALMLEQRPLVILDDPRDEHILDYALALLASCPTIVTSRHWDFAPLANAQELELEPLEMSASLKIFETLLGSEAVEEHRDAALEIVNSVMGLPLALRVLGRRAARSNIALDRMAVRLAEAKLDELRYGAVRSKRYDVASSLRTSYELLDERQQRLFSAIGVFQGVDFDTRAAAAVARMGLTDAEDSLSVLHDVSLLQGGRNDRWRLHPVLREYARTLSTQGDYDESCIRYFRDLVDDARYRLEGPDADHWTRILRLDYENIIAALQSSIDKDAVADARTIASAMYWYWSRHGQTSEGARWIDRVLAMEDADDVNNEAPDTEFAAGALAWSRGDLAVASEKLAYAAERFSNLSRTVGLGYSLTFLSLVRSSQGKHTKAKSLAATAIAVWQSTDDRQGLAFALSWLGWAAECRGDRSEARSLFDEALPLAEAARQIRSVAWSLVGLGVAARGEGDLLEAQTLLRKALAASARVEDDWSRAFGLAALGETALDCGDESGGHQLLQESLTLSRTIGDTWGAALALIGLGRYFSSTGLTNEAALAFAAAVEAALPVGAVIPVLRGLLGAANCLTALGARDLAESACRIYVTVVSRSPPAGVCELANESGQDVKATDRSGDIEISPAEWCRSVEEYLATY